MIDMTQIITLITAVISSGGISALVTARITAKKADAENRHTDQETEGLRIQNEITEMDYINKRLQEISEINRKEANELRAKNESLNERIGELNHKMQTLMEWVVTDNYQYRSWLESQLKQVSPNIEFPTTTRPPIIFKSSENPPPVNENVLPHPDDAT